MCRFNGVGFRVCSAFLVMLVAIGGVLTDFTSVRLPNFVVQTVNAAPTAWAFAPPSTAVCANEENQPKVRLPPASFINSKRKMAPLKSKSGAEAKQRFLAAISPQALAAAIKLGKERGWSPTDTFTILESDAKPGLRRVSQDGDIDLNGEGRVLTWDWDTGDPDVAGGTMIVETWNPSTSTTFQAEYWAGDDWGYTSYARFLESRDREGRIIREASSKVLAEPPVFRKASSQGAPTEPMFFRAGYQPQCAQIRASWRSCMRDCLQERLNASLWTAVGGGVASARPCAGYAGKAGLAGPYAALGVFVGCMVGGSATAGALAMVYNFGVRESCDSATLCGPSPTCQ